MRTDTLRDLGAATRRVGGVPFRVTSLQRAVDWVIDLAKGPPTAVNLRFLNAWNVALAHGDAAYRALVTRRGINFPDGTPVVWFLNLQDDIGRSAARVRGPSLFNEVLRQGVPANVRHFLLGGTPEVLQRLTEALTNRYDGIRIVGSFAPPFAPLTHEYVAECVERIAPTRPELVWVGLGTPKQDYAGDELCAALGIPVLNVGAAFDFTSGAKREAPVWMQRSGLEWLFRLITEPRRLWRRYLLGNVRFLFAVLTRWPADRRAASR
jgi:N-acetylglucosaminyldiphosphoundecaprenol N-acetyl-beta-D-mannosaminyltransferase